ncbi:STAS domain-containing protein [Streptomyces sp. NBC_01474]|uniref:STAS domain-containing protein n=1 Tax=Streptomyces sp. NBC_01474 TaxID=2903880 RepID=UPI002DDBD3D6|nr:STAS domain-containing protein [Streptomyces sp. NBC_01474]WSE01123.1 STAS domain-containing protein [Streptomyces sp. NBC_01474]
MGTGVLLGEVMASRSCMCGTSVRQARPETSPQGIAVRRSMHPEFAISHHDEKGWTVVEVRGEVDASIGPRIREYVSACIEAGRHHLIVDLVGVPFMDSTGLGLFVHIGKLIRTQAGDLRLAITNPNVLKIFHITNLHRSLQIYDSVETAME